MEKQAESQRAEKPAWLAPFENAGVTYAKALSKLCGEAQERLAKEQQEYLTALASAWMYPDCMGFLRQAAENYSNSVARQLLELSAPRAAEEAFRTYVSTVRQAWSGIPAEAVDLETWAAIQHCLQVGAHWRGWSLAALGRPSQSG